MKYRSILFALDGAYIFDNEAETVSEVWDLVNDMGSRWIFYPIPFVVKNVSGQNFRYSRIIDTPDYPECFKHLIGKSINKARKYILDNKEMLSILF